MGGAEFAVGDKGVVKLKSFNAESDSAGDAGGCSEIVAAESIFVTRTQVDELVGGERRAHANGGVIVAGTVYIGGEGERLVQSLCTPHRP